MRRSGDLEIQKIVTPLKEHANATVLNTPPTSRYLAALPTSAGPGARSIYDRNFVIVCVAHLAFVISNTLLSHYARWVEFLGGSVQDVGMVLGTAAIVAMLLRPFVGSYIDGLGARNIWFAGLMLYLVGLLSGIYITQLNVWVYVTRIMILVGQGLVFTSGLTYISQVAPRHRQTEAFAVFGSAGFVGMFLGPYLGEFILGTGRRRFVDWLHDLPPGGPGAPRRYFPGVSGNS